MAETSPKTVTIAKRRFELRADRVERALRQTLPEPITSHYVVICKRRYPPKQAISLVTGLDRADFTTHQARRILTGLGFPAGRRPGQAKSKAPGSSRGPRSRGMRVPAERRDPRAVHRAVGRDQGHGRARRRARASHRRQLAG